MAEVSGGDTLDAALREIANKIGRASLVRVGFLEGSDYPDGTPVAEIAAINNFGAPEAGIPPRPFFSDIASDKSQHWGERFAKVLTSVDYDVDKALEIMGAGIADQLRDSIVNDAVAPNSPVTDLLKQRFPTGDGMTFSDVLAARDDIASGMTAPPGKPLSWSGHMLASVGSEVE